MSPLVQARILLSHITFRGKSKSKIKILIEFNFILISIKL
jgi:hypothetical protein